MPNLTLLMVLVAAVSTASPPRLADPCRMWVWFDGGLLISNCVGECRNPEVACGQVSAFNPQTGTTTYTCYCGPNLSHTTACKAWLYTYSNGTFLIDCVDEDCSSGCTNPAVLGAAPQPVCNCD